VYFFFLYALVLHSENKRAVGSRAEAVVPIAPAEATPAS
jgi:hypothetical protein